ncbi:MAG: flagellar basal body rod protein FlgB [Syntrophomonadaceae bacterium]|nr:flagellar basal body rod protein FlgB [Syntrophomonadaceae bacterium]MDD3898062.1 flagellar basal body rod protein FlgB [Syntrophomonadaceae bacterium]MDD4561851.1 flagellar basal body rod protein FlgB [Syntrophomonadaceae bacterium]
MLEKVFTSPTQSLLNKGLDTASVRNRVIADNIANVDTPGFKRREVIFEENIKKVLEKNTINDKLRTTDSRHMQIKEKDTQIEPEIRELKDLSYRNDENNVDIDVETAKMTKNKLFYDALGQSMSNEIRLLRMAITGRG